MDEYVIDVEAGAEYTPPFHVRHGIDLAKMESHMWPIIEVEEMDGVKIGDKWQHEFNDTIYTVLCFAYAGYGNQKCVISTTYLWCTVETVKECLI